MLVTCIEFMRRRRGKYLKINRTREITEQEITKSQRMRVAYACTGLTSMTRHPKCILLAHPQHPRFHFICITPSNTAYVNMRTLAMYNAEGGLQHRNHERSKKRRTTRATSRYDYELTMQSILFVLIVQANGRGRWRPQCEERSDEQGHNRDHDREEGES